jgi:hypothetical protein
MRTNTFMDNAAIGAVLVAILVNVLHGAFVAASEDGSPPALVAGEVSHV